MENMRKRNICSFILWIAGIAITLSVLHSFLFEQLTKYNINYSLYNRYIAVGVTLVLFAFILGISFVTSLGKIAISANAKSVITIAGFGISIAGFFGVRIVDYLVYNHRIDYTAYGSTIETAAIGADGKLVCDFTGVSGIYTTVLSVLFKFLGNTDNAVFVCQLLFAFVSLIILAISFKSLFGRVESVVACIGISCFPLFIDSAFNVDMTVARLFVWSVTLGLITFCIYLADRIKLIEVSTVIAAICVGLLYIYDVSIIYIGLLYLASVIFWSKTGIIRRIINSILFLAIMIIIMNLPYIYDCIMSGRVDINALIMTIQMRFRGSLDYSETVRMSLEPFAIIIWILGILYFISSFFYKADTAYGIIPVLLFMIFEKCYIRGTDYNYYYSIILIILFVLSGAGIRKIILTKGRDTKDTVGTDITEQTEKKELTEEIETDSKTEPDEIIEEVKPTRLINPLPVPKPHEKKQMDFDYSVSDYKMYYDIDVDEANNDYDI